MDQGACGTTYPPLTISVMPAPGGGHLAAALAGLGGGFAVEESGPIFLTFTLTKWSGRHWKAG
jgi:hypothetical protein